MDIIIIIIIIIITVIVLIAAWAGEEWGRSQSSQCDFNSDVAVCFERCIWRWLRQTYSLPRAWSYTGKYSRRTVRRDVRNGNFISVRFSKKLGFSSEWVWFGSVWKLFNTDIVVIYYLCNTWVVHLQQISQHYCAVLNELCILCAKLGFGRVLKPSFLHIKCK